MSFLTHAGHIDTADGGFGLALERMGKWRIYGVVRRGKFLEADLNTQQFAHMGDR